MIIRIWPTVRGNCTWSNKDGLQKCAFEHIYSCPSVRLSNLCKLTNFEVMDYSYQNTTLVLPSCKNWNTTKSMMSLVQAIYSNSPIKITLQESSLSEKNTDCWAPIRTNQWRSESETEFVGNIDVGGTCWRLFVLLTEIRPASVMWGIWKLSHWLKHYQ